MFSVPVMYLDSFSEYESGSETPAIISTWAWCGVCTGVCRSRNALLNGDTSNYDWDSGYTCHQLGSGAIMVQLGN